MVFSVPWASAVNAAWHEHLHHAALRWSQLTSAFQGGDPQYNSFAEFIGDERLDKERTIVYVTLVFHLWYAAELLVRLRRSSRRRPKVARSFPEGGACCRICHGEEASPEKLLQPCSCRGTQARRRRLRSPCSPSRTLSLTSRDGADFPKLFTHAPLSQAFVHAECERMWQDASGATSCRVCGDEIILPETSLSERARNVPLFPITLPALRRCLSADTRRSHAPLTLRNRTTTPPQLSRSDDISVVWAWAESLAGLLRAALFPLLGEIVFILNAHAEERLEREAARAAGRWGAARRAAAWGLRRCASGGAALLRALRLLPPLPAPITPAYVKQGSGSAFNSARAALLGGSSLAFLVTGSEQGMRFFFMRQPLWAVVTVRAR